MLKNKTRCVVLVLLTIYCGGLTLTARWVLSSESQQQQQQLYRSPSLENEQVEHVRQGLLAIKSGFSGRTWGRMRMCCSLFPQGSASGRPASSSL